MRRILSILICVLAPVATAPGGDEPPSGKRMMPPDKPRFGSVASQKLLKMRIWRRTGGSLAASVTRNLQEWDALSPDQREQYRKKAFAFLTKNPGQQDKMLDDFRKFLQLSARKQAAYRRRAQWLKAVIASFSPEQRKELTEMSPDERAKKLIQRRDQLVADGKLKLEEPSTQPAQTPTTQPSGEPAEKASKTP